MSVEALKGAGCPDDVASACPPEVAAALAKFDMTTLQKIVQLAIQYGPQVWAIAKVFIDAFKTPTPVNPNVPPATS